MRTLIAAIAMMAALNVAAQEERGFDDRHAGPGFDGADVAMHEERMDSPEFEADGPMRGDREKLTPQQRAELKAKHLTLALDLTDKQQKDIQKLVLDRELKKKEAHDKLKADREAGKVPTADERFAMKSQMLDEQIAMKREIKKILSPEQFTKFEKMHKDHAVKRPEGGIKSKKGRRR